MKTKPLLEAAIARLNTLTVSPQEAYKKTESGSYDPQDGNFHLDGAYGGYRVERFARGGGTMDPLETGYTTIGNLLKRVDAYAKGIIAERKRRAGAVQHIPELGIFVRVSEGALQYVPEVGDQGMDDGGWIDLTAPDAQETLDLINAALDTGYRMNQFDGR